MEKRGDRALATWTFPGIIYLGSSSLRLWLFLVRDDEDDEERERGMVTLIVAASRLPSTRISSAKLVSPGNRASAPVEFTG